MKRFSRLITRLLALILLLAVVVITIPMVRQFVTNYAASNVYKIMSDEGYGGTSFQFDYGDGYLVTASHVCVRSEKKMMNVSIDDEVKSVIILAMDELNDVCILEKVKDGGFGRGFKPSVFDEVFTVGYAPSVPSHIVRYGHLLSENTINVPRFPILTLSESDRCHELKGFIAITTQGYMICVTPITGIETNFSVLAGNSGSPLVNILGQVIGVVVVTTDQGLSLSIDIKHVVALIDKYESEDPAKQKGK